MKTLTVHLCAPLISTSRLIESMLEHQRIESFKIQDGAMILRYEPKPPQSGIWL